MPRRARRATRKPRRAKRRNYRRGGKKSRAQQMAKIVETIEFNKLAPNQVQAMTFNLNQFQRARTLATNFRWYKPTKVTWTIKPQFNVFQSAAGSSSVPYIYQLMNRTQDSSFVTQEDLLSCGAKPRKLTATHKTSYRPNWCSPGLIVQNVVPLIGQFGGALNNVYMNGLQAQYGWLQAPNNPPGSQAGVTAVIPLTKVTSSANTPVANLPSATIFNGHQVYIDQQTTTPTVPTFEVTCQVHWSFKDPKNILANPGDNIFEEFPFEGPTGPTGSSE